LFGRGVGRLEIGVQVAVRREGPVGHPDGHTTDAGSRGHAHQGRGERAHDRPAVAAVGHHHDAHAGLELRPQRVELVVNELAIVQDPGLVHAIALAGRQQVLVVVGVRHLPAMARVRQEKEIIPLETLRGLEDRLDDGVRRRLGGEQAVADLELALLGERFHVARVGLASAQRPIPGLAVTVHVMAGVHPVEADVKGNSLRHNQ
jgi:hypothetical protein